MRRKRKMTLSEIKELIIELKDLAFKMELEELKLRVKALNIIPWEEK